ncbi:MAG: DUF2996 domain-containing protein [Hormoscilla sp. SP12CHS1]|nr:DUF2996 domain-containing protein [Hormoscilla sp. SP12CHS1]
MAEETEQKPASKPAGKKPKPPALEDKPFAEFIGQHYLPALETKLAGQGISKLDLKFVKQKIPIRGLEKEPECWQVIGNWVDRQFNVYFLKEDIKAERAFSYAMGGSKPATLEPFLIDERKITLDLLVFGVLQRLNGQKWLALN